MRELDLVACQPRGYQTTTVAGEDPVVSPDLIEREFTAPAPGQRLVGEITIYARRGLAVSGHGDRSDHGMVVGWQLAEHMRTSLVTDALAMGMTGGQARAG